MKKVIFLFAVFVLLQFQGFGQGLVIDSLAGLPDTVSLNDSYTLFIDVKNPDNTTIAGDVSFRVTVNNSPADSLKPDTSETFLSFQPQEVIPLRVKDYTISTARFKKGDNIVVVWPVIDNKDDGLEYKKHVFVEDPSGIITIDENGLAIGPNPAKDYIIIDPKGVKFKVDYVRILSITGIELRKSREKEIFLGDLPQALYLVELTTTSGNKFYKRIVRQDR